MQACGMDARPFHAGMRREVRMKLQKEFLDGRLRILCATSAFGMGAALARANAGNALNGTDNLRGGHFRFSRIGQRGTQAEQAGEGVLR